jgi:hypothetical protein
MRRTNNGVVPREREDAGANGCIEVDYYSLRVNLRGINLRWDNYHQIFEHVQAMIRGLPADTNAVTDRDLGIKYLVNDITEDAWKKELKKRLRATRRQVEVRQIYEMFVMTATYIFQTLVQTRDPEEFKRTFRALFIYVNNHLKNINNKYKSVDRKYFLIDTIGNDETSAEA